MTVLIPQRFTSTRWTQGSTVGFIVPEGGIEAIREASQWVQTHEGVRVPFLNAEGMLIRFNYNGYNAENHWAAVGELVAYDTDGKTLILHGSPYGWEAQDAR